MDQEQVKSNVKSIGTKVQKSIKIDYKTLNSADFNQALGMLANQAGFSNFQAAYNVAKIAKQFFDELKVARELYNKWSDEFIAKDDLGKPITAKTPQTATTPFELKEGTLEQYNAKMEEFLKTEITLHATPILASDMGTIKLTPAQIVALEPLFDVSFFAGSSPATH